MIVWPGLRRSVSAISRLFNSASFYAPLTHTAVPQRAAPGTTATFTRATAKTVENNDGYLVTLASGEIGFPGARRVRNLLSATEDFSNAAWTLNTTSVVSNSATDPLGGTTADTWVNNTTGNVLFQSVSKATTDLTMIGTLYVKKKIGDTVTLRAVANSTIIAGSVNTVDISDGEWHRVPTLPFQSGAFSSVRFDLVSTANGNEYYIWGAQLEDVTARTDQTTPSEYVSVGVPSDWAGDELVTNGTFDTDTTGWTAGLSAVLSVVSNEMQIENGGASFGYAYTSITTVVGSKYVVSALSRVGTTVAIQLAAGTTPADTSLGSTSTASATNTLLTFTFTATGTTTYITFQNQTNTVGHTSYADNISVKPAYYHGSFVDGVKCFNTDLAGNALTTMRRYNAEGARTNLLVQSQTLDNASWTLVNAGTGLAPVVTANYATAPDGTMTADRVQLNRGAGSGSGNYSILRNLNITGQANPHTSTHSLWMKTTGGGTANVAYSSPYVGATIAAVTGTWTRFEVSASVGNTQDGIDIFTRDTVGGDQTVDILVWGVQVELGSFASSYIATTTAAQTRNADVLTYSSAGNIDGTKGWCYAGVSANWSASPTDPKAIAAFQSSIDYGLWYLTSANNLTLTDGAAAAGAEKSFTILPTAQKVAATWSSAANSSLGAAQGVVGSADTFGTAFTPDQIGVGIYRNGTVNGEVHWFGNIGPIYIGQRQLSASEMQAITR